MKKILVVDDNPSFSDLVEMVFGTEYEIVKAVDGEEGLGLAARVKPDLILLDVMMPRISGIEMLRRLQSDLETRSIPVLILSASHFDPEVMARFEREPNVRSFLRKPCGVETLREKIRTALGGGLSEKKGS